MSATKRALKLDEQGYLMDREMMLSVVGFPEDIIEDLLFKGDFPDPVYGDFWFAPDVYRWVAECADPQDEDGDNDNEDEPDPLDEGQF